MAKAFGEVTPTQFQMLYLIVNNCNLKKSNSIEMYNGFMMDKMGLSVRMVQYNIKALEEKGFIKVDRPSGRNAAKKPNIITMCEVEKQETCKEITQLNVAINGAIDCTPYKKEKENKNNLYVNKSITTGVSEVTEIESTSKHNELKGEDMVKYTQEEVRDLNEIYSKEWKELEETRQSERNTSKYNEINEWVGKKLSRGYDLLKSFRSTKTREGAMAYVSELNQIINQMSKAIENGAISEGQRQAFIKFDTAFGEAVENKNTYFNTYGKQTDETKQSQTVKNGESAQDYNLSNEDMEKAFNSNDGEDIEKAAPTATPVETKKTPSRDELVKQGKRVTWDIKEMAEKAQELASSELSDETINEKVDEWVFYHTAAVPTTVVEIYKSMMKNKISGLRATGEQNTDAA